MDVEIEEFLPLAAKIAREFSNIPGLPTAEIEMTAQEALGCGIATTGLKAGGSPVTEQAAFEEIVRLIEQSRLQAVKAVNTTLIDLYWNVGEYISHKIQSDGWGKSTVQALSSFVQKMQPGIRGFSPQNIWRMRQFFETYRDEPVLSPLLRELPWSSNLHILSRSKRPEEREFYLRMASHNHWQVREVARQMDAALFERSLLNPPKLSTVLRELYPQAAEFFKDIYSLEFLGLPAEHSEAAPRQNPAPRQTSRVLPTAIETAKQPHEAPRLTPSLGNGGQ